MIRNLNDLFEALRMLPPQYQEKILKNLLSLANNFKKLDHHSRNPRVNISFKYEYMSAQERCIFLKKCNEEIEFWFDKYMKPFFKEADFSYSLYSKGEKGLQKMGYKGTMYISFIITLLEHKNRDWMQRRLNNIGKYFGLTPQETDSEIKKLFKKMLPEHGVSIEDIYREKSSFFFPLGSIFGRFSYLKIPNLISITENGSSLRFSKDMLKYIKSPQKLHQFFKYGEYLNNFKITQTVMKKKEIYKLILEPFEELHYEVNPNYAREHFWRKREDLLDYLANYGYS